MTNDHASDDDRQPPSIHSAFVVHFVATGAHASDTVRGRIEHIASGEWTRFTSVAELVGFMRHTLAIG